MPLPHLDVHSRQNINAIAGAITDALEILHGAEIVNVPLLNNPSKDDRVKFAGAIERAILQVCSRLDDGPGMNEVAGDASDTRDQ